MTDILATQIADRRDELADLTAELIRFPTVNPPGEAYRPCAEFVGARLERLGFQIEYIRADGAPGDSDLFPRVNVVGRREGRTGGRTVAVSGTLWVRAVACTICVGRCALLGRGFGLSLGRSGPSPGRTATARLPGLGTGRGEFARAAASSPADGLASIAGRGIGRGELGGGLAHAVTASAMPMAARSAARTVTNRPS